MRLISFECPNCKAPLKIDADSGRKFLFCEYCGRKIFVDDGIRRSEHTENINITHRMVDEVRLREADIRLKEAEIKARRDIVKQNNRAARRRVRLIILVIILGLFAYGLIRNRINRTVVSGYEAKLAAQVRDACNDHSASLERVSLYRNHFSIDVLSSSSKKEDVDALQDDILSALQIKNGYYADLYIEKPKYHTIRKISINKYGSVSVDLDETNDLSDEEQQNLIDQYMDQVAAVLEEYGATISKLSMESNRLKFVIDCNTCERGKLDQIIAAVIELNLQLEKKELEIRVNCDSGSGIRTVLVSTDGKQEMKEDYSNSMTDEEARELVQLYLVPLKKCCKNVDARLSEIKIRKDTVMIEIAAEYKEKNRIAKLEKAISEAIEGLSGYKLEISITGSNRYDTIKEWTVDENGITDVRWDFTEE